MSEKKEVRELCPLPSELTFKGVRKAVLDAVWKRAEEDEKKGIPLTTEDFGKYVQEEWDKMKQKLPKMKADYLKCLEMAKQLRKEGLSMAEIEKELDKFFAQKEEEVKEFVVAEG